MRKIDNIGSILSAVDAINLKPKKKKFTFPIQQKTIPKLNQNLVLPLDVDKIIREAEEYKIKLSSKTSQVDSIQNKIDKTKKEKYNKNFEDVQVQSIEDLYSKFSKKIKKNTLKIIFNLHLEIKDLENQLKNFQLKQEVSSNKNTLILKDEYTETSKTQDASINNLDKILSRSKSFLKDEVVTSLKIQDSTISLLNEKIERHKNTEEKLRFQIIDLEQDKFLTSKKAERFEKIQDFKNFICETKETLQSVYKQVEIQKIFFLDLKNQFTKNEGNFNFYKENYENLIIQNNDLKKKLANTKLQVEAFEEIKKELVLTFKNFNNVLSKNSIIKLNESFSKIDTNFVISDVPNKKDK